jgi:PAS domain S-box-containing protein
MGDRLRRYATGIGLLVLAISIRVALHPWLLGTLTHPTVFIAVLLTAWYCGKGPAILNIVLGYLGIAYFLKTPFQEGWLGPHLAASVALYGGLNAVILLFVARHRGEHERLETAMARQEEVERALRRSEERYRSFVEASAQIVWTTSATGEVLMDIPAWQAYTGQSAQEARGFGWLNAIRLEDRSRVVDSWRSASESRSLYEVEYLLKRHDGCWRHVLARGVPIKNSDGSVREYIGTCIDITDRRQAEEELRRSEEQLRVATLAAEIGVWSWIPGTSDVIVSANWRHLFGVDDDVAVTLKTWRDALHPDDRERAANELTAASEQHREFNTEYRVVRPDGTVRWVVDRGRAWYDEAGSPRGMAGVNVDITERKLLEDRLRSATISAEHAKTVAEHANRAKDDFLAVLSHELRTPLTPVLAAVQLMQLKPHLNREIGTHLDIIRRNLDLEARLIDDLLDLTRIVNGKIVLDRKPLDIRTVIERVIETCKPDIEARKLHLGVQITNAPHRVNGDASRLQQVFWNVLKNAIKFTPDGGCVEIRLFRENDHVVTEVADTGIGIEPESIPRVFNAFEQEDRQITRRFGGLGLGLAITKRLVEMHEGTISADSQGKDRGTTLHITLPYHDLEPAAARDANVAPREPTSRRILLVEDHGDTALMIQMLLQISGYEVTAAGDVKQALEAVTTTEFDVLISDLGLPDRSGLDLIRELRRGGSTIRAIALSGFGREEDVRRSREAGFSAHLTKPVDIDALIREVERN